MNIPRIKLRKYLFTLIFLFSIQIIAQNNTYYVSTSGNDTYDGSLATPWLTIQGAINNGSVSDGDKIIVKAGTYTENVNVTKEITIQSENGYSLTTVHGPNTGTPVIQITSNNVTIDGLTVYGATSNPSISSSNYSASILLRNVSGCSIKNNRCGYEATKNSMMGIELYDSGSNLITNNICSYNLYSGIALAGYSNGNSDNNTVQNNICSHNGDNSTHGIGISISSGSDNNKYRRNTIENNYYYGVLSYNNTNNFGDLDDEGENSIINNGMYDVYFDPTSSGTTLNAYYNYWGSNDATTIEAHIHGAVNFDPWLSLEIDLQLNLTVMLEGSFNNGEMNTSLLDQSSIPTTQPYNTLPWEYSGTENVDPIPEDIVDWVLVELRTAEEASSMVKQIPAFVDKNGKVVDLDGVSSLTINYYEGYYFIVIYHRNHLPVMTSGLVHLEP